MAYAVNCQHHQVSLDRAILALRGAWEERAGSASPPPAPSNGGVPSP
jgi:hypothetical protein